MITSRISILVASTLAIAAFACSSAPAPDPIPKRETSPTTPDKQTPGKNTPTTPGGDDQGTQTPGGEQTPTGGDGAACLQKTDAKGCFTCCDAIDPKAFDEAYAASDACLCGATGACKTQCANTVCKGNEPDSACGQCLDSQAGQKCEDTFIQTCESKASCKTVMACEDKCAEKFPQQRGGGG